MILSAILFFIFGTIVGSFLNVVILRYNSGRSAISGRSSCPVCRHELKWFELVPVLSFLLLGGKCSKCRSKISWQYPAVELFTGLLFAGVYFHYFLLTAPRSGAVIVIPDLIRNPGISWIPAFAGMTGLFLILDLIIFSILIVILVYDLKHKIIPDGLVYTFALLSFLKIVIPNLIWNPGISWILAGVYPSAGHGAGMTAGGFLTLNLLAGPVMFLPFFLLWLLSGGRWMGLGDAKLAVGIGWFLGFFQAISAIVIGFWSGAVIGVILLLIWRSKKLTMKSEIPFAPFLILGLLLVYFFGIDVTGLHLLFQY